MAKKTSDETALATTNGTALGLPKDLQTIAQAGYDIIQTGGITKWVDMENFKPGDAIEGVLLGMRSMEDIDKKTKETIIRYFFNIRLIRPCPVNFKSEDGVKREEIAGVGEVVSLGERSKLEFLRELCDDGGLYQLFIQPHTKIPIGGGQTLWTFNVGKMIIRPPMRVKAELTQKTPF